MALKELKAPGRLITELMKGSYQYTIMMVKNAFYNAAQALPEYHRLYVEEVFDDYITVEDVGLPPDERFKVSYKKGGEGEARYVFADREDWEHVQLGYTPVQLTERGARKGDKSHKFQEITPACVKIEEAVHGETKGWPITGIGVTADMVNANGRRYSTAVLLDAIREARQFMDQSLGQGAFALVGESDHPTDKGNAVPLLTETIINWKEIGLVDGQVLLSGVLVPTMRGKDTRTQFLAGIVPGISQRAYGLSEFIEEDGHVVEEVIELHLTAYDLTPPGAQADVGIASKGKAPAQVTLIESRRQQEAKRMDLEKFFELYPEFKDVLAGMDTSTPLTVESLQEQHPDLVKKIVEAHKNELDAAVSAEIERRAAEETALAAVISKREATVKTALGLGETEDLVERVKNDQAELTRLQGVENERTIRIFIEKEITEAKYPDWAETQLRANLEAMPFTSLEDATVALKAQRSFIQPLMAQLKAQMMGAGAAGLRVLGPVIERDLGIPAYARMSHEISERMVKQGLFPKIRDLSAPKNPNELFAAKCLEQFDTLYKGHLISEMRQYGDAEQAADLSLPYSVSRAVVAEALANLVSSSVFDFDVIATSPTYVWYETFANDDDLTPAVVGSGNLVLTAMDTATAITGVTGLARLVPGTVVVEPSGGGTAYTEGTDYIVDYDLATVRAITGGTMTASPTTYDVDFEYNAIRLGEMAEIQRGKMTLASETIEAAADRLATEISREAILFSSSQLGWDATGRTIAALVREITQIIDQALFYKGLAAALSVTSNSGGSFVQATDALDVLIKYIGVARVKVSNRFYTPQSLVLSATNSDMLSNWDGFTAAGSRADAELAANGFVGRVKGLNVFETTQFSDGFALVVNRELVMHRVFSPMTLRGPYHSIGSNRNLISADQYFVEEFNASVAPVPEKGAYVIIG